MTNKNKTAPAPKPAPKASANPKNAEKPANIKSTFGTPKKQKKIKWIQ